MVQWDESVWHNPVKQFDEKRFCQEKSRIHQSTHLDKQSIKSYSRYHPYFRIIPGCTPEPPLKFSFNFIIGHGHTST